MDQFSTGSTAVQVRQRRRPALPRGRAWDERTNRPLSTRCGAHGGLADAAFMGEPLPDSALASTASESSAATVFSPSEATMTPRTTAFGGHRRGLQALVLAAALCLCVTTPALAGFESAVAAYENGSYQQARSEFEILAAAADERAEPYLERIRGKIRDQSQPDGAGTSPLMESVSSIFDGSEASGSESTSGATANSTPSYETAQPGKAAPDRTTSGWQAWSPQSGEHSSPPPEDSDVVTPQRGSIWSAIFFLPGDATVVGLQYVAQFLSADNLNRELQILSRKSDRIALSILAVGWWLVIIKMLIGVATVISRYMKVAACPKEQQHYG